MQVLSVLCGQRTLEAANLLLQNSRYMQEHIRDSQFFQPGTVGYAKEWCTVKVGGPRRTGHSWTINELIKQFDDQVIVITPTLDQSRLYTATHKASIRSLDRIRGLSGIRAVIVDCVSVLSKKELAEVYGICACLVVREGPFHFILMQ